MTVRIGNQGTKIGSLAARSLSCSTGLDSGDGGMSSAESFMLYAMRKD